MRTLAQDVILAAQNSYKEYKVLPSVQLAQYVLESAWGSKVTGKYNFFGIKAHSGSNSGTVCWTHEVVDGKTTAVMQRFANYNCLQDAFDEHAHLLSDPEGPYAKAIPYLANMERFVSIIAPIYATDRNYANSIINLIRVDGFQKYDSVGT